MRQLEHAEQVAVIQWSAYHEQEYPALRWLHAIPNGGARDARVGAMLKREGVRKGVADLFLPWPARGYHGLYLEMKRPGAIKEVKPEQREFMAHCETAGYLAQVHDSADTAIEALKWYLEMPNDQA